MSALTAFLENGDRVGQEASVIGGRTYWPSRPRTICEDGFSVSIQAGQFLYCSPRQDEGPWTAVEVGFPSAPPEPWDEWSKYVEDPDRPTETVYGYVPVQLVLALIESHGGEGPA